MSGTLRSTAAELLTAARRGDPMTDDAIAESIGHPPVGLQELLTGLRWSLPAERQRPIFGLDRTGNSGASGLRTAVSISACSALWFC